MSIITKILPNGLKVVLLPRHHIPRVAIQVWYNVGSKDEKEGQRGFAHLLEHMLYKGTQKLSETDVAAITQKLSGSTNAFTSHDYTGYEFELPSNQWYPALEILADTMSNCTLKAELLASEMKAVIQELKMYSDDYEVTLEEKLMALIFDDHPYHHPIIGYKHDLFSATSQQLHAFYKAFYGPANATLVIVGDVHPADAMSQIEKYFAPLSSTSLMSKQRFYRNQDIVAKSLSLQRDVQQPVLLVMFEIPGVTERNIYHFDQLIYLIGSGRDSRLYKKLVYEHHLLTDLDAYTCQLFEHDLFCIKLYPRDGVDEASVIDALRHEFDAMREHGFSDQEVERAHKKIAMDRLEMQEDLGTYAHEVAMMFLATGNPNAWMDYETVLKKEPVNFQNLLKRYFGFHRMHSGWVKPLQESEYAYAQVLQEHEAALYQAYESRTKRKTLLEQGTHVHQIVAHQPPAFAFPHPQSFFLPNGLRVLWHNDESVAGKIEIYGVFKNRYYDDPLALQGMNNLVCAMLLEGTRAYSAAELMRAFETLGMSVEVQPGAISISLLREDLPQALALLGEIVERSVFPREAFERVHAQVVSDIKEYWDDPYSCIDQYAREQVYAHHPYSKNPLGTLKTVRACTRDSVEGFYKKYISPHGAVLSVVGDLAGYDVPKLVEKTLGGWQGQESATPAFPLLHKVKASTLNYPMRRDQVALAYAGISMSRLDHEYDALLIADAVLTGGSQDSMQSRLFQLREQTGLFYTIDGSLLEGSDAQPGMIFIKTLVSPDDVAKTEQLIEATLRELSTLSVQEFEEAQRMLLYGLVTCFDTQAQSAQTFAALHNLNLPLNYFDQRSAALKAVTLKQTQACVTKYVAVDALIKIRVGRVKK